MMKIITINKSAYAIALCILISPLITLAENDSFVDIQTNHGVITVQLATEKAPVTAQNFLTYVDDGFYDNTLFHRVIDGFMIQGGGFNSEFELLETRDPIVLESNVGLSNIRGAISMARRTDPDSASSQFFINTVDNSFLDYQDASRPGYAVFGAVIGGMDVVDTISALTTGTASSNIGVLRDVPDSSVIIEAIRPREGQLSFSAMQSTYSPSEVITVHLEETMSRQNVLDLWAAILDGNGRLIFVTEAGFSDTPVVFREAVSENTTSHPVFNFTVPEGLVGQYTLLAIFNKPGAGIEDLTHSLRSNIAQVSITLTK